MQIKGKFDHFNIDVLHLEKSLDFYRRALGLTESHRKTAPDGSFVLVYLTDNSTDFFLELTWLRDRREPYELGDNESHLCLRIAGNYDKIREYHREMGWICYENPAMGIYFIHDPDDHWIEVLPEK